MKRSKTVGKSIPTLYDLEGAGLNDGIDDDAVSSSFIRYEVYESKEQGKDNVSEVFIPDLLLIIRFRDLLSYTQWSLEFFDSSLTFDTFTSLQGLEKVNRTLSKDEETTIDFILDRMKTTLVKCYT